MSRRQCGMKHCFTLSVVWFIFSSLLIFFSGILNHLCETPQGSFHPFHTLHLPQFPKSPCSFRHAFELNKWQARLKRLIMSVRFYMGNDHQREREQKKTTCGFSVKVRHQHVVMLNNKYVPESFHMADYVLQKAIYFVREIL